MFDIVHCLKYSDVICPPGYPLDSGKAQCNRSVAYPNMRDSGGTMWRRRQERAAGPPLIF
jgi:hypothetical protein